MEKKYSTSKASKASKNTKEIVRNSKTFAGKSSKQSKAKEILFAGKISREANWNPSKWELVSGSVRMFTEDELEVIHSIRLYECTSKESEESYWKVFCYYEAEGKIRYITFTPDLKLIDKGQHGDWIDPESFKWYKLTDGKQEIERARGKILKDRRKDEEDDMPY